MTSDRVRLQLLRSVPPLILAPLAALSVVHLLRATLNPRATDFGLYYTYCRAGIALGLSHVYDPDALQAARLLVQPAEWWPNVGSPVQIAVMLPFAVLPLDAASWCWSALQLGCLVLCWHLLTAGQSLHRRLGWLIVALALPPVMQTFQWQQPVPMVAAAVVASWWLQARNRPWLAGVVLAGIAIKPQLALLVPLALLAAGRLRTVAAWAMTTGGLGLLCVIIFGPAALASWVHNLAYAAAHPAQFLVVGSFGLAPLLPAPWVYLFDAGVVALVAAAGRRGRGAEIGVVYAAGLLGSVVAATYVHPQDWAIVALAAAVAVARGAPARVRRFAFAACAAVFADLAMFDIPVAVVALAWLVWLAASPSPAGVATVELTENRLSPLPAHAGSAPR